MHLRGGYEVANNRYPQDVIGRLINDITPYCVYDLTFKDHLNLNFLRYNLVEDEDEKEDVKQNKKAETKTVLKDQNLKLTEAVMEDGSKGFKLIIEGKNGQVEIYGNKSTKSKYITKYLHVGEGEFPNVNVLNKDMLLFNATNDAQLRIMLKPGAKVGTTDYVLQVYEPKLHNFTVFMDNGGSYYTGEFRTGMFYNCKSLSGERDALSLGTIFSEGTQAVSFNYSRNIGNKGEKLYFGYNTNAVKQVREDRDIYSKGHANVINLGYN